MSQDFLVMYLGTVDQLSINALQMTPKFSGLKQQPFTLFCRSGMWTVLSWVFLCRSCWGHLGTCGHLELMPSTLATSHMWLFTLTSELA